MDEGRCTKVLRSKVEKGTKTKTAECGIRQSLYVGIKCRLYKDERYERSEAFSTSSEALLCFIRGTGEPRY